MTTLFGFDVPWPFLVAVAVLLIALGVLGWIMRSWLKRAAVAAVTVPYNLFAGLGRFLWSWLKRAAVASVTTTRNLFSGLGARVTGAVRQARARATPSPTTNQRAGNIAAILLATVSTVIWIMTVAVVPGGGVLSGLFLGGMVALFVAAVIPRSTEPFMIVPNKHQDEAVDGRYRMSRMGFFTDLQPGRVKVKTTWNGSFITMLMDWDDRHFKGENPNNPLRPDQHEYWEVEQSGLMPDSHPLPFPLPKGGPKNYRWWLWIAYSPISIVWWMWKRTVYSLTGAVWVGVPGFRTIRIYPLDRLVARLKDDGDRELVHKWDYSDHYRVGEFQLGIKVPNADTQNMMPIKVEFNEVAKVVNPFLTAFNTEDQWPARFSGAGADAITSYTRSKPAKEVIGAKDKKEARAMGLSITKDMRAALKRIGITVLESQYIDASAIDAKDREALAEPARADAYREGKLLRAQGDAAPVLEIGRAMREYPEAAHIPAIDGMVRAVGEAGDRALMIFGEMQGAKPLDVASIQQLRELNARLPAVQGGQPAQPVQPEPQD